MKPKALRNKMSNEKPTKLFIHKALFIDIFSVVNGFEKQSLKHRKYL